MKYQIQGDSKGKEHDFEIVEVRIIKETARARITTWSVAVWLILVLIAGTEAALSGRRYELYMLIGTRWLPTRILPAEAFGPSYRTRRRVASRRRGFPWARIRKFPLGRGLKERGKH
jgi:hypothetical protein